MTRNKLRARLQTGVTSYGLWITLESISLSEIAVALGLDWVCIDMEHGHLDYGDVVGHLRAVRGSDTALFIRSVNDALLALRGQTEKRLWF